MLIHQGKSNTLIRKPEYQLVSLVLSKSAFVVALILYCRSDVLPNCLFITGSAFAVYIIMYMKMFISRIPENIRTPILPPFLLLSNRLIVQLPSWCSPSSHHKIHKKRQRENNHHNHRENSRQTYKITQQQNTGHGSNTYHPTTSLHENTNSNQ